MQVTSRKVGSKNAPVKEHEVCPAFENSKIEIALQSHNHQGSEFYIYLGFDKRTYRLTLTRQEAFDLRRTLDNSLNGTAGSAL